MKRIIIISTILLFISVIFSCKKDDDITEPDNNDTTTINEIEPTGNDLINFQTVFGNENAQSSIYQMQNDNNGNFYYRGKKNDKFVIGKLNTSGSIIWEQNLNFTPFDFIVDDFITIVGKNNSAGIVAVYNINEDFISDEIWNNYNKVFFNDITSFYDVNIEKGKSNNKYFVTIGGAGNSTIFPYATNFQISSSGDIEKTLPTNFPIETDKLFTDYPEMRFNKFAGHNSTLFPVFHITTYTKENDEVIKFSVAQFTENLYDIISLGMNIDWITEIKSNSFEYKVFGGNICYGYNNFGDIDGIYAVGRVEVDNSSKSSNITKSNYWTNCVAVKINVDGEILWKNEYQISDYLDGYYDCIVDNNYLYAIGKGAGYNSDNNFFGYGLVSKISTTTGNIISSKLIGRNVHKSTLNTVLLHNNKLFLGGLTNYYVENDNSTYQSWFVEFNHNGM